MKKVLLCIAVVLRHGGNSLGAESLKTVRVMTRALSDSIVIYEIGNRLGFYREEGFDIEIILAKIITAVQAVLGGSADHVNHRSAVPAIMRGVPSPLRFQALLGGVGVLSHKTMLETINRVKEQLKLRGTPLAGI